MKFTHNLNSLISICACPFNPYISTYINCNLFFTFVMLCFIFFCLTMFCFYFSLYLFYSLFFLCIHANLEHVNCLSMYKATNGGGMGTMAVSLTSLNDASSKAIPASTDTSKSIKDLNEFSFQMVHEAFGKEIMQDINERKRLKELSQRPLIEL